MIDFVFNNGWKSGDFNLILVDVSMDHGGQRMAAAIALLGFGVALIYRATDEQ
jgi:hypothetical protein